MVTFLTRAIYVGGFSDTAGLKCVGTFKMLLSTLRMQVSGGGDNPLLPLGIGASPVKTPASKSQNTLQDCVYP